MRFTASREDFMEAVAAAARAGILGKMDALVDHVTLTGTDGNQWRNFTFPAAVTEPGLIATNLPEILRWLKLAQGDEVSVTAAESMNIQCGRARIRRPMEPVDSVPFFSDDTMRELPFTADDMIEHMSAVAPHAGNNPLKEMTMGVWVFHRDGHAMLAAIDGISMGTATIAECEPFGEPFLIPSPFTAILEGGDAPVQASDRGCRVGEAITRLIQSGFPAVFNALLDSTHENSFVLSCDSAPLLRALDIAGLAAEKDVKAGTMGRLHMQGTSLAVSSTGDGHESSGQEIDVEWDGPERMWTISIPRLKKCITSIGADRVEIWGSDDSTMTAIMNPEQYVTCYLARIRGREIPET